MKRTNRGSQRGHGKGSSFERKICRELSLWVSGGKRTDLYWRAAMSGGRATFGRKRGEVMPHHSGDIVATHPEGYPLVDHFFIECKHYRDLNIASFMFGKGLLYKFWMKAEAEADSYGKEPLLIAKQNSFPTLVLLPGERQLDWPYVRTAKIGRVSWIRFSDLVAVPASELE